MLSNETADSHERREQSLVGELDQSPFHYLGHVLGLTHWVKRGFFYPFLRAIFKIQINLLHNGRGNVLSCQLLREHCVCVKDLESPVQKHTKERDLLKTQKNTELIH